MNFSIVLTSIFENGWLERITEQIVKESLQDVVKIYFIPDNKTPNSLISKCSELSNSGFKIVCPTMDLQRNYLKKLNIENFILENSDHRRNIGYLMAYEDRSDFVLSMDDDNFPSSQDFFQRHISQLNSKLSNVQIVDSSTKFYNNCLLLEKDTIIHPRGYPFDRKSNSALQYSNMTEAQIGVNAGMWSISPDVDAISWLVTDKKIICDDVENIALSDDTYCPVNSQNTSLLGHLIPAYYFIRMNYDIGGGLRFDRLGDIYSGYFLQKVAKSLDLKVNFGKPLATHERNSHNYLADANGEWGCLRTINEFCDWLVSFKVDGNCAKSCYRSLSEGLDEFAATTKFKYMPNATSGFYHQMAYDMRKWLKVIDVIDGERK